MMTAYERLNAYTDKTDLFFLTIAKAGSKSVFMLYSGADLIRLADEDSNALSEREDGYRWSGMMVNHLDRHYELARFDVPIKWNEFQANKAGFMSDAQEQLAVDALNGARATRWTIVRPEARAILAMLQSIRWTWTGHNHRRGIHDAEGMDVDGRTWRIEVKGVGGRLFHS